MTHQAATEASSTTVGAHEHDGPPPSAPDARALARAAALFRAAGDPERLRLLALLADGERCVTELAGASGAGLSTTSQRLRVLRTEGLVATRREAKHIHYRLLDRHVADMVAGALDHAQEDT